MINVLTLLNAHAAAGGHVEHDQGHAWSAHFGAQTCVYPPIVLTRPPALGKPGMFGMAVTSDQLSFK